MDDSDAWRERERERQGQWQRHRETETLCILMFGNSVLSAQFDEDKIRW